jgi:hypothetical protein
MAKLFLADLHPIASTGMEHAFPYLFIWLGWIKKCFKGEEKSEKQILL